MAFCAPSLVYGNSWLSQTSSLGSTTIYTAPSGGLFRGSAAANMTGSGGGHISMKLNGNEFLADNFQSSGIGTSGFLLSLFSGDVITISATITSGTPTYNLYAAVEQLV